MDKMNKSRISQQNICVYSRVRTRTHTHTHTHTAISWPNKKHSKNFWCCLGLDFFSAYCETMGKESFPKQLIPNALIRRCEASSETGPQALEGNAGQILLRSKQTLVSMIGYSIVFKWIKFQMQLNILTLWTGWSFQHCLPNWLREWTKKARFSW